MYNSRRGGAFDVNAVSVKSIVQVTLNYMLEASDTLNIKIIVRYAKNPSCR
jgi:hypothetical protein